MHINLIDTWTRKTE